MLQPDPLVVEVIRQPQPTRDITYDFLVGMFAMAGVLLLVAAVGSLVVAGVLVLRRRLRQNEPPPPEQSARRLRM